MRYAIVNSTARFETVERYLPSNYTAMELPDGQFLVVGEDRAGWTLDGYVIPRLSSGLIGAREVRLEEVAR